MRNVTEISFREMWEREICSRFNLSFILFFLHSFFRMFFFLGFSFCFVKKKAFNFFFLLWKALIVSREIFFNFHRKWNTIINFLRDLNLQFQFLNSYFMPILWEFSWIHKSLWELNNRKKKSMLIKFSCFVAPFFYFRRCYSTEKLKKIIFLFLFFFFQHSKNTSSILLFYKNCFTFSLKELKKVHFFP